MWYELTFIHCLQGHTKNWDILNEYGLKLMNVRMKLYVRHRPIQKSLKFIPFNVEFCLNFSKYFELTP